MTEYEKLFDYLDYIYGQTDVHLSYGYVCYYKDYIKIAREIPKDKIIVDVGCSFGLQQLLFKEHKRYIGIQKFKEGINAGAEYKANFSILTDNAEIIQKRFKDITAEELGWNTENQDQFFGIANHSLWHDITDNKEDIELFKRLFPKNHYATTEMGEMIKF